MKFLTEAGFARRVPTQLLLCATSVSSAPLWLFLRTILNHRDAEDTEVAQRRQAFRAQGHRSLNRKTKRRHRPHSVTPFERVLSALPTFDCSFYVARNHQARLTRCPAAESSRARVPDFLVRPELLRHYLFQERSGTSQRLHCRSPIQ